MRELERSPRPGRWHRDRSTQRSAFYAVEDPVSNLARVSAREPGAHRASLASGEVDRRRLAAVRGAGRPILEPGSPLACQRVELLMLVPDMCRLQVARRTEARGGHGLSYCISMRDGRFARPRRV